MGDSMFDIDHLMSLGVFNQLIPIWQVFFYIASMLPFLLWNRVKICLLITYLFTYYLRFIVQGSAHIASNGSMHPFVLYSLSGVAIAVFFVATIFPESPENSKVRWMRYRPVRNADDPEVAHRRDPIEVAVNIT